MPDNPWPERAKHHLQELQEAAYDELARLSGLGSRLEAYRAFVGEPLTPDLYEKWREEFEHKYFWPILNYKARQILTPGKTEPFNMFERYREWFFSNELPTPYENPLLYPVLLQIVNSIKEGVERRGIKNIMPPQLLFGTLPTGSINACAIPVPDSDECLTLFDFGLFQFTGEMAKILARLIPAKLTLSELKFNMAAALEARYAVDQQPDLVAHFQEVLARYLVQGKPRWMPQLDISNKGQQLLAGVLMDAARSFIIGHEMGHLLCRHVSAGTERRQMVGRVVMAEVIRNWDDEYEADHWGFNYEQVRGFALQWALVGSTVFFSCWRAVERCLIALLYGRTDLESRGSDTHPPVGDRQARLRGIVQDLARADDAQEIFEWSDYIDALVDALADRVSQNFRLMHLAGTRPFGTWARY